jgi:hypothetical protein
MLRPEKLTIIESFQDNAEEYLRFSDGGRRLLIESAIEMANSHGIHVSSKTKGDLEGNGWGRVIEHIPAWSYLPERRIFYRKDCSEQRQRTSILHEIYHILNPPPPELKYPENWLPPNVTEDLGDRRIVTKWQQSQSGKVAGYEEEADAYARARALRRETFRADIKCMSLRNCLIHYGVEADSCLRRIIDIVAGDIECLVYTCRPEPQVGYVTSQKDRPLMILPWRMGPGLKSLTTYMYQKHRFQFPRAKQGQSFEGSETVSAKGKCFVLHWVHFPFKFRTAGQLVVLVGQRDLVSNNCAGLFREY